jgi:hypothetical protein
VARIYEVNPQSFLTAENQIGAVVFTYFNINNCVADNMSVRTRGGVPFLQKSFSDTLRTRSKDIFICIGQSTWELKKEDFSL